MSQYRIHDAQISHFLRWKNFMHEIERNECNRKIEVLLYLRLALIAVFMFNIINHLPTCYKDLVKIFYFRYCCNIFFAHSSLHLWISPSFKTVIHKYMSMLWSEIFCVIFSVFSGLLYCLTIYCLSRYYLNTPHILFVNIYRYLNTLVT